MSIEELIQFFNNKELSKEIQLNRSTRIVDTSLYLKTSIAQVIQNGDKSPAYKHLIQLYDWVIAQEMENK